MLTWLNILAVRQISVKEILIDHWKKYGRNFYARHDYEGVDTDKANAVMDLVRHQLNALPGQTYGNQTIKFADSFTYEDPIDGSVSENQGLRIGFESGSRFVLRLSGTGTVGATLRLYVEKYVTDPDQLTTDNHAALADIVEIAQQITDIKNLTGRQQASLIT